MFPGSNGCVGCVTVGVWTPTAIISVVPITGRREQGWQIRYALNNIDRIKEFDFGNGNTAQNNAASCSVQQLSSSHRLQFNKDMDSTIILRVSSQIITWRNHCPPFGTSHRTRYQSFQWIYQWVSLLVVPPYCRERAAWAVSQIPWSIFRYRNDFQ